MAIPSELKETSDYNVPGDTSVCGEGYFTKLYNPSI